MEESGGCIWKRASGESREGFGVQECWKGMEGVSGRGLKERRSNEEQGERKHNNVIVEPDSWSQPIIIPNFPTPTPTIICCFQYQSTDHVHTNCPEYTCPYYLMTCSQSPSTCLSHSSLHPLWRTWSYGHPLPSCCHCKHTQSFHAMSLKNRWEYSSWCLQTMMGVMLQ